jgi:hypothetical protein
MSDITEKNNKGIIKTHISKKVAFHLFLMIGQNLKNLILNKNHKKEPCQS